MINDSIDCVSYHLKLSAEFIAMLITNDREQRTKASRVMKWSCIKFTEIIYIFQTLLVWIWHDSNWTQPPAATHSSVVVVGVLGGWERGCSTKWYWRGLVLLMQTDMQHYGDVIMGALASQITSLPIVYLTVCSGVDQGKHQSSASLAFVWVIHRWSVNSPHKWPVRRKMLPFHDVIMKANIGN